MHAFHRAPAVEFAKVDLRRRDRAVPHQLLQGFDVAGMALEVEDSEGGTEGVRFASCPVSDAALLVSRGREREYRSDAVALESKRSPGLAAVAALPELAVGEAGEEATVGGEECVGHRR